MGWFSLWIFPRILNMSVLWEVQFCGLSWFFFQWSLVRWHHKDSSRNIWKLYFAAIPVSTRDVFMLHVEAKREHERLKELKYRISLWINTHIVCSLQISRKQFYQISIETFLQRTSQSSRIVCIGFFYFYFHHNVWWQLRLFDIKYFWASFTLALTLAGSLFNEKLL